MARLRQGFTAAMDAATQAKLRASFVDPLLVPPAELPAWLERLPPNVDGEGASRPRTPSMVAGGRSMAGMSVT